jgi:hypothetical protein
MVWPEDAWLCLFVKMDSPTSGLQGATAHADVSIRLNTIHGNRNLMKCFDIISPPFVIDYCWEKWDSNLVFKKYSYRNKPIYFQQGFIRVF